MASFENVVVKFCVIGGNSFHYNFPQDHSNMPYMCNSTIRTPHLEDEQGNMTIILYIKIKPFHDMPYSGKL